MWVQNAEGSGIPVRRRGAGLKCLEVSKDRGAFIFRDWGTDKELRTQRHSAISHNTRTVNYVVVEASNLKLENSLPCWNNPATCPYPERQKPSPPPPPQSYYSKTYFKLSFQLRAGLPRGLFPSGSAFMCFPIRATCSPPPQILLAVWSPKKRLWRISTSNDNRQSKANVGNSSGSVWIVFWLSWGRGS